MQAFTRVDRRRGGLTLLELMISVAIIGILSAAAIPAFRMYQFRSKRSEAYANLESIRKAQVSYKAEYDNFVQAAPSPGILLGADKQNWHARGHFPPVPGTGFDELGWRPEGPTYFDYDTVVDDDGSGAYFTARHKTPWGDALNFDGRHSGPARAFFMANACYWAHEYHVDGLRLDATHAAGIAWPEQR